MVRALALALSLSLTFSALSAHADEEHISLDPPPSHISKNWYWYAGGLAFVGGLSQLKNSNIAFAALESGTAFYMMHEWYQDEKAPLAQLITPLALTTLALINVTLLQDKDATRGDVFRYNAAGLSLISLNYFWSY
jgi:hypothetical protein